jgi:hypothetical protein
MVQRDYRLILVFTIAYFGLFSFFAGFHAENIFFSPIVAWLTERLIRYSYRNKWDAMYGTTHWVIPCFTNIWAERYRGYSLKNAISVPEQTTRNWFKRTIPIIEELERKLNADYDLLDTSPALRNPQTNGGQVEITINPAELPAPPEPMERQQFKFYLETIIGVSLRRRPRHIVIVCIKMQDVPLSSEIYCRQGRTRTGDPIWHIPLTNSTDFGRQYDPIYGSYRLYLSVPAMTNLIPPEFWPWLEKLSKGMAQVIAHWEYQNRQIEDLKSKADQVSYWKKLYNNRMSMFNHLCRTNEEFRLALARENIPTGYQTLEQRMPKIEGAKRGISRLSMMRIACVAGAFMASWIMYLFASQTPAIIVYGPFMPYLLAGIVFGAIIYLFRRKIEA